MPVDVRFATADDVAVLEPRLRQADRDELIAATGPDISGQLVEAVGQSVGRLGRMAFAAEHDGELVSLFGFVPASALSSTAFPWMVGTAGLERIPGMLKRIAVRYCGVTLEEYPLLVNYVDARNTVSIRWLGSIGFDIQAPERFGVAGLPFHRFEMRG